LITAILALGLVIGLIFGLAWLLRRLPGTGLRPGDGLRVVAGVALGNKERAVVVDINGTQLLLGVTAGAVSLLHTLEQPLPEKAPARLPEFAPFLRKWQRGG